MADNPLSARFNNQQKNRLKHLITLLKENNIGRIGVKEALLYAIDVAIERIEAQRKSGTGGR